MLPFLFLFQFLLLLISSSHAAVQDFCVADPTFPETPAGYACKNATAVTADDFVFSSFAKASPITNINKFSFIIAFDAQLPGLNGLGVSVARADIAPGGIVPLHSHPAASEVVVIIEGSVTTGFISSTNNKVYTKTLKAGDVMALPQGLLHFQVNAGNTTVTELISFSSPNPGLQFTENVLFANDLPSELVEKVTLINAAEVRKLKAVLGGTG